MKRQVLCIVLLFLMGFCIYYWSSEKKQTVSSLNKSLETISYDVHNDDFDSAKKSCQSAKSLFEKKEYMWQIFANHDFADDLNNHIAELETYLDLKDKTQSEITIVKLKNHINDFYKNNKLTLSNIL